MVSCLYSPVIAECDQFATQADMQTAISAINIPETSGTNVWSTANGTCASVGYSDLGMTDTTSVPGVSIGIYDMTAAEESAFNARYSTVAQYEQDHTLYQF